MNDESAPDGHSYNLYRVLTLAAQTYTESLLNDESALDGCSSCLYRVLILTTKPTRRILKNGSPPYGNDSSAYTETLLKSESLSDGSTVQPTRGLS